MLTPQQELILHRKLAHLKYVPMRQRSEVYEAVSKHSRAPLARSLKDMLRATPKEFTVMMRADTVMDDLTGSPCAACEDKALHGKATKRRFPGSVTTPTLGPLTSLGGKEYNDLTDEAKANISRTTASHACLVCRRSWVVTLGNPLFPTPGRGVLAPNLQMCIHWCTVEGWSETSVVRSLGVSEANARKYMEFSKFIMSEAALREQEAMRFGFLPNGDTTLVEPDESAFGHFAVKDGDDTTYYWYVAVGVAFRGQPENVYVEFQETLSHSKEKARLPKLKHDVWARTAPTIMNK